MVTQPWQTEEQKRRTEAYVEEYREFFRNIFTQDIHEAKRRPEGLWPDIYSSRFWNIGSELNGRTMLKEAAIKALRKLKRIITAPLR